MTQPVAYSRQYNFTAWSAAYPSTPPSGVKFDLEYNAIKATTDAIRVNLALLQRDDGELSNLTVGLAQLKPEVSLGLVATTATDWLTATTYTRNQVVWQSSALYICLVAHTSGVFATDLAASKWQAFVDYTNPLGEAQASAAAALASEAAAAISAAAADADAISAAADAAAAAASAAAAVTAAGAFTLPLPTTLGGHGGSTASQARSNLAAAWSGQQIIAGTGLTGGGTFAADRTLNLANTSVAAASYGSALNSPTFTVDAQGRLTAAANVAIAIPVAQITDMSANARTFSQAASYAAMRTALGVTIASAAEFIALAATDRVLTPDNLAARPYFRANKNGTNQTGIADITNTKVTFTTEAVDNGAYYDAANSRWTPPAGPVQIEANVTITGTFVAGVECRASIYKNGADFMRSAPSHTSGIGGGTVSVSIMDVANGTDYYEIYAYGDVSSGTITVAGALILSSFTGIWLG